MVTKLQEKKATAMLLGTTYDETSNCYVGSDTGDDWPDAETLEPITHSERQRRRAVFNRWRAGQCEVPW